MTTKDDTARPGKESLKDFRGAEPDKDGDTAPTPPVNDDEGSPPPADVKVAGTEDKSDPPAKAEAPAPVKPANPFDAKRARISERFGAMRAKENGGGDTDLVNPDKIYGNVTAGPAVDPPDEGDPPPGDKTETTPKTPASPGSSDSKPAADKPEQMTLVVRGKTVTRTLAEVASLSELSLDEVKADPQRAIRYAQKQMAGDLYLEETRQARRDTPSRTGPDNAGTRPASPAPEQERPATGDDAPDQPQDRRRTSDEDLAKLIEDIQIGDPKEIAPKLKAILAEAGRESASEVVQQNEGDRLLNNDRTNNVTAIKEFIADHPEVEGKPIISSAMAEALYAEYREDLTKALVAEGMDQDEAADLVAKAEPDHVKNAHQRRRLGGDPNVRKIDKAMMESAYERVKSQFGVTGVAPTPKQPQDLSARQQRKENLPQQPRRASVPPATPNAPPAPQSRRSIVAEMAQSRTGKKPATLTR